MKTKMSIYTITLVVSMALGASFAIAAPPSKPYLLECTNIPSDSTCFDMLQVLCDKTDEAPVSDVTAGFKKKNDHDFLVSKVVGAALKYEQGEDGRGDTKLEEYGNYLNNKNCFPGENKPKIWCDLQESLNKLLIVAQGDCPPPL